jgi:hypothetical protein
MKVRPQCPPTEAHVSESGDSKTSVTREDRYPSHALVELRRHKLLPFNVHSAVLLDISISGWKAEFTGDVQAKAGDQFWLNIPLTPLGIFAPARLMCRGECRWFDSKRFRVGGVFTQLAKTDRHILEQVIETLRQRGALVP